MAKSLKIQIELAGAEEIKRQLEGVGQAGEEAFNKIVAAAKEVGGFKELDPTAVTQLMQQAGVTGSEAFNKIALAVRSAGRMETLINALTSVENGLGKIQAAATAMDNVLGKALVRSLTMVARLLPAAFAAATVGAIAVTTKALLELDRAAIQLGVSIGELAKAQEIFRQLGADSKEAAKGVAEFFQNIQLEKVKEAASAFDEFGRQLKVGADWMKILQDAAKGTGEAADLARKKLVEMGKLDTVLSPAARALDDIKKSTMGVSEQILKMLGVFEKMGPSAERNRLIFQNFNKELATLIIQALDAGVSLADIEKAIGKVTVPTKEAALAAFLLRLEWQNLKNMFAEGLTVSPEALNMITNILRVVRETITAFGQLQTVAGALNIGGNTLRDLQGILNILEVIGIGIKAVGDAIILGFQTAWNAVALGAQTVVQTVLQLFGEMPAKILSFFDGLGSAIWEGIVKASEAAWDKIITFIQSAINKLREFFSTGGGNPAIAASGQGMARGGMVGGRGSGTSDSNLAWLSRGEHVMPAYAVRQPGVLQLLEALRRSGGNLRGVLDRMGHFALGGMVGAPAFASGGSVGGMSNVTIQFPGLPPVTGLRASSVVVDELRRSAALAQVRSGGRKPTRYI